MSGKGNETTRRQFLEVAAASGAAAAAVSLAGTSVEAQAKGRAHYKLFSEGQIGSMKLKNRIVRSAAYEVGGSFSQGEDRGKATEGYLEIIRGMCEGGVGLYITGYMSVIDHEWLPAQLGTFDDRFIPGLAKVAEMVHGLGNDCKIVAEIGHGGVMWGPSGYAWPTKRNGKSLSIEEVETFCTGMAEGARRLKEAGFDGVQIHGAHHYLINAFLSPWSNRRTDKYGGSLVKRVEIVREIVAKTRDLVGSDYPILIKLNCDDGPEDDDTPGAIDLSTFPDVAKEIEKAGVDAIDISGQQCPGDPFRRHLEKAENQSPFRDYANALDLDIPVILGVGNKNIENLEKLAKENDKIDFVSFARPLFREPDLINRWLEGRGSAEADCISCSWCYHRIMRDGMTHCWQIGKSGLDQGKVVG